LATLRLALAAILDFFLALDFGLALRFGLAFVLAFFFFLAISQPSHAGVGRPFQAVTGRPTAWKGRPTGFAAR
jgi:hypothetical protein